MKKIYSLCLIFLSFVFFILSCVDEVEDINPGRPLDAPGAMVSANEDTVAQGDAISLSIALSDVPGKIDSFSYTVTDGLGKLVVDQTSFDAIKGKEKGTFNATYTAPNNFSGKVDIVFTIYDTQEPKKSTNVKQTIFIAYKYGAPTFTISPAPEDTVAADTLVEFTLKSIKAPGGIGSITYSVLSGAGTIVLDPTQLSAAIGKTQADVKVKFTGKSVRTGRIRLSFTVTDNTPAKRSVTKTKTLLVTSCFSDDYSGTYKVKSSGTFRYPAATQDSTYKDSTSIVTLALDTIAGIGIFKINDVSFGLYAAKHFRSVKPTGRINVCSKTITNRGPIEDQFGTSFTLEGVINNDNTISITWSNTAGDTGKLKLTKQ